MPGARACAVINIKFFAIPYYHWPSYGSCSRSSIETEAAGNQLGTFALGLDYSAGDVIQPGGGHVGFSRISESGR